MRVPLLNFEGGPGFLLTIFEGDLGVPLLNFKGGPGFRVPLFEVPGPRTGSTFIPCLEVNRL